MECEEDERGYEDGDASGDKNDGNENEKLDDELFKKIKKYKKSEMITRLYFYETIWDTLDNSTRSFLDNIGNMIGITARNYGYRVGILLSMVFEPKSVRFVTKEKVFDSTLGGFVFDTKVSTVFFNNLLSYDFISKREIEEMVEAPEEEEVTPGV